MTTAALLLIFSQWKELIGYGIAAVGGFLAFREKVIKPAMVRMKKFDYAMERVPEIDAKMTGYDEFIGTLPLLKESIIALKDDVTKIKKEVTTNTGSSMKDAQRETLEAVIGISIKQKSQIEADSEIITYLSADGRVENVSHGYTEMTGLDSSGCENEGWQRAIHPDDSDRVVKKWHDALDRKAIFFDEIRYINVHTKKVTVCKVECKPIFFKEVLKGWVARREVIVTADAEPEWKERAPPDPEPVGDTE